MAVPPVGMAFSGRSVLLDDCARLRMTDSEIYPRDLIGYGRHPPDPRWPNGARIAVSIVLNYEEGGESCILHGDTQSESVLTDVGGDPLPNARNLNVESNFEYGSRVGFWEIMRVVGERQIDATVYAVGMALERNPDAAVAIAESGLEVACHGYRWIDYQDVTEPVERADIRRNIEVITRLIGRRPLGWYTGRPGPNTRRLVVEAGGFLYDSDAYNDDIPYWIDVAGHSHLVIPYTFDTNDSRLQRGGDFATGEDYFVYCRDAFDWLYRSGCEGRPRLMSIGLHGRIIGRPGRIGALARLLDHIQHHDGVWLCNRMSVARHWIAHHSPAKAADLAGASP
jgi:allantoinase